MRQNVAFGYTSKFYKNTLPISYLQYGESIFGTYKMIIISFTHIESFLNHCKWLSFTVNSTKSAKELNAATMLGKLEVMPNKTTNKTKYRNNFFSNFGVNIAKISNVSNINITTVELKMMLAQCRANGKNKVEIINIGSLLICLYFYCTKFLPKSQFI